MKPQTYCRMHRLTQSAFGKRVGLDKATISRLFNGIPISVKNAIKIEEKTGGAVTRADARPDLRVPPRSERIKAPPSPASPSMAEPVSETETQDKAA